MTTRDDARIPGRQGKSAAEIATYDPVEAHRRDLRKIERMSRIFEGAAELLERDIELLTEFQAEKLGFDETEREAGKLGDRIRVLHKSLQSIFETQERLARQAAAMGAIAGGLDVDAARDEIRRRLDRLHGRLKAREVS